jgi:putative glutamine amidotransferase
MRPLIAVPTLHAERMGSQMVANHTAYLNAIEATGGIPLLIQLSRDESVLHTLYDLCQGLLLTGGVDMDPACYGEEPHEKLGDIDAQRDEVEIMLTRRAIAEGKPLLGICRGVQVMNVAMGGTLYQDVPSQLAGAGEHRESGLRKQWDYLAHSISIAEDSWLAAQLGTSRLDVNTLHHQAIKDLAAGLRVTATAPDGVIEAVEGLSEQFLVGIQCHPERLWDRSDPRWRRVFAAFVERCKS